MSNHNGVTLKNMTYNGQKVKKWFHNDSRVFSAGNVVTYYVDSGVYYREEVDSDASCLNPTAFTPSKSGWTFVGWREDTTASNDVLSSKVMGDEPITLYAVFKQDITLTYYDNNSTAKYEYGSRYYNAYGNTSNPSFTMTQTTDSGWTCRGWSTTNKGDASIQYANGATITLTGNLTIYGLYQTTATLSYNGNGATSGSVSSQSGTIYWAPAGYIYPTVTLKSNGFTKSGYSFVKWAMGSANGTQYSIGTNVTLTTNTTMYAYWVETTKNYGYTGGIQSFTAPVSGTYNLAVWGAQGGSSAYNGSASGGKGGYATGDVYLSAGTTLYIGVGGVGSFAYYYKYEEGWSESNIWAAGGYNGGGNAYTKSAYCGSGGGATHIAKGTNRGVLSAYASNKSEILIVAGGGGGGGLGFSSGAYAGGTGGGTSGGDGSGGKGGTQSAGGTTGNSNTAGSFGKGGSIESVEWGAGGGAGWYGGSVAPNNTGGGGGSGYIGGVTGGSMNNGQQSGNGKATITFVSAA